MEKKMFDVSKVVRGRDGALYDLPTLFCLYRLGRLVAGTVGYELAVRFMPASERRMLLA